jgi:glyoxylase-like metal-dependent hydrolase (beta-lactamase superfamily II)
VQVEELRPRLWRWTTRHPEWTTDEGGEDGWGPVVSSTYHETDEAVVLIDPLVPEAPDERERFLRALDRDVERVGAPLAILLTIYWHERSAEELAGRYGAAIWAPRAALRRMAIDVSHPFEPGDAVPGRAEAVDAGRPGEVLFWLAEPRALVAGDVLLGSPTGIRLLPESWLKPGVSPADLRRSLRPVLELPIELIVLAHGDPVLDGAHDALARSLAD